MRNRDAYMNAGRKDPHSDQQRLEHPYDFVSLPDRPAEGHAVLHHRIDSRLLTGTLRLKYRLDSPLHVGSGHFENAKDMGFRTHNRTIRCIMRSGGLPVLPGSSWKGAVRSRFEAITSSRLGVLKLSMTENADKLPQVLKDGTPSQEKYQIELKDEKLERLKPPSIKSKQVWESRDPIREAKKRLRRASPADALFGFMGYLGRVRPGEGRIEGPTAEKPLDVPASDTPQPHRLAMPGAIGYRYQRSSDRDGSFVIERVEGRKFYYDGDLRQPRDPRLRLASNILNARPEPSFEPIDHVPAESTITIDISLTCLNEAEIGTLLIAAGEGDDVGIVRFGGYKSAGLGKATLIEASANLYRGPRVQSWRRGEGEPLDLKKAIEVARNELVNLTLLKELHTVTTMRRPKG